MKNGLYYSYQPNPEQDDSWWSDRMKTARDGLIAVPALASNVIERGTLLLASLNGISAVWIGSWKEWKVSDTPGAISEGGFYRTARSPGLMVAKKALPDNGSRFRIELTGKISKISTRNALYGTEEELAHIRTCLACSAQLNPDNSDFGYCSRCRPTFTAICAVDRVMRLRSEMEMVEGKYYTIGKVPPRIECVMCHNKGIKGPEVIFTNTEGSEVCLCLTCAGNTVQGYHRQPSHGFLFHDTGVIAPRPLPDVLYIGAEIETINPSGAWNYAASLLKINDPGAKRYFLNTDGSLRGQGFEWITMPHTMNAWEEKKDWYRALFSELVKRGMRAHDTDCCGLHFHVSRSVLTSKAIEDLFVLFERNFSDFLHFSRRTTEEHFRWCARLLHSIPNSDPFQHYSSRNMEPYDPASDKDRKKIKTAMLTPPRGAINIGNSATVEFRMFKGTLNFDTFWASLKLVEACVRYVRDSQVRMEDTTFDMLVDFAHDETISKYWEYRKSQPQYERVQETA